MSLCIDIETSVVDAIDASMTELFEMMLGEKVECAGRVDLVHEVRDQLKCSDALAIMVGFSGELKGSLCLCLPAKAACCCAELLIQHETDVVDQVVVDTASEFANIVVGGAKRRLSDFQLTMSLPSAIRADQDRLVFPTTVKPIQLLYRFRDLEATIVVALAKNSI